MVPGSWFLVVEFKAGVQSAFNRFQVPNGSSGVKLGFGLVL